MWLDLLRWVALYQLGVLYMDPFYRMKMQNALLPKNKYENLIIDLSKSLKLFDYYEHNFYNIYLRSLEWMM